jgi:hypothetical protein
MVIFDGPSRIENLHIFVLQNLIWVPAEPEDKLKLQQPILQKYKLKNNLNNYVGFIGFETNSKYMVYKVKDTGNLRSTGFRCDQAGKKKTLAILGQIEGIMEESSKQTAFELCVRQEFTLRNFELDNSLNGNDLNFKGKTWFLDTETAIINEFEKKEKK